MQQPSPAETTGVPRTSFSSSRLRELRQGLVDALLTEGIRRPMLDLAVVLDLFDTDALDRIPRLESDREHPDVDRALIQLHNLAVRAILADLEHGVVDERAAEIANAVADVLESHRMYSRADSRWVRDEGQVAIWREAFNPGEIAKGLLATPDELRADNLGHYRGGEG